MIRLPPQYFKVIPGYYVVPIKHEIFHGGLQRLILRAEAAMLHILVKPLGT